jgi:dihydrofolate reductase
MAKLILQMQCSLDGFVCGPHGELAWAFPDMDAEYRGWIVERLWRASAHLMGAVTYRDMAAHWPTSREAYAEPMNRIPKIVFSSSIQLAEWERTEIIAGDLAEHDRPFGKLQAGGDFAEHIARLKREREGELLAHGGVRFARSLIRSQLVDEYRLMVHPIALGRGRSIFADLAEPVRLAPIAQTVFQSGLVATELRPIASSRPRRERTNGRLESLPKAAI